MSPSRDRAGVFHPDFSALYAAAVLYLAMSIFGCEVPISIVFDNSMVVIPISLVRHYLS